MIENKSKGLLGYGGGRVAACVANGYPCFFGVFGVDIIVAGGKKSDVFEIFCIL